MNSEVTRTITPVIYTESGQILWAKITLKVQKVFIKINTKLSSDKYKDLNLQRSMLVRAWMERCESSSSCFPLMNEKRFQLSVAFHLSLAQFLPFGS